MGFKTEYVEAIKHVEDLVEVMFEKLSHCCKYCELAPGSAPLGPTYNTCLYYGRKGSQRCEREDCPLLEEDE